MTVDVVSDQSQTANCKSQSSLSLYMHANTIDLKSWLIKATVLKFNSDLTVSLLASLQTF